MTLQLAGALAERTVPLGDHCPIDRTMQLVGNRTAVLLLREAFYGATRFDDMVRRVGVTEAVASQRLRELVAAGVLEKSPYREPGQRTRYEYVLTDAGHELLPVLMALTAWGKAHIPGGGPTLSHAGCGEPVEVALRCAAGHEVPENEVLVTGRRLARS
ncbi:winged helix-turn-helix transcriptional regulator [Nocardioides nematodiphilus]|uniref:winged helix-turn-helix transcriptional regulator n=1 Tax=Nocardioides nematodiphilus TaxID=2849669 RepID=UPI001CD96D0C|nr:helix-turn-helix domain-containing protein [Nocardioides nematodiphilus]MCA1983210.1 helix-turn-helix transcriptional regulator [Nocardioides nematodiphilus]